MGRLDGSWQDAGVKQIDNLYTVTALARVVVVGPSPAQGGGLDGGGDDEVSLGARASSEPTTSHQRRPQYRYIRSSRATSNITVVVRRGPPPSR